MHRLSAKELTSLAEKWLNGTITQEEERLFNQWYDQNLDQDIIMETADENPEAFRERVLARIKTTIREGQQPAYSIGRRILRIAAAAAVLLLAGSAYFWFRQVPQKKAAVAKVYDIVPGGNKAVLTLANGQRIILDNAQKGQLAKQGNSNVVKVDSGILAYQVGASSNAASESARLQQAQHNNSEADQVEYNTLTTPRGGQYRLVLPDGSKVWLNAGSSIKYPTAFTGNVRQVVITGEAYFEVKHNDNMPFMVKAGDEVIKDIGTAFNINAYEDESTIKTTLLEGAVQVNVGLKSKLLRPGEQSILQAANLNIIRVDTELVVAWKNGQFIFQNDNIQSIMRMVSRWYNVQIVYNRPVPADLFSGVVSRFDNVSTLLQTLEATGRVHFSMERHRIVVSR